MNLNPFPEIADDFDDDDRVPVTVMLLPAQAARLEVVIADVRDSDPSIDDDDVADALFETGLAFFESMLRIAE